MMNGIKNIINYFDRQYIIKKVSEWLEQFPPVTMDDNDMFYIRYQKIRLEEKHNTIAHIEISQDIYTSIVHTYTGYYTHLSDVNQINDSDRVELELGRLLYIVYHWKSTISEMIEIRKKCIKLINQI